MVTTQYDDLAEAAGLLLERDLEMHRRNIAESARLAAELAQIDDLRHAAQADVGAIGARQVLGADALWQGWLVAKRADILRRTAMVRAQQADSLARARTAFSRSEAARSLVEAETRQKRQRRLKAEADAIEAIGVLRMGRDQGLL